MNLLAFVSMGMGFLSLSFPGGPQKLGVLLAAWGILHLLPLTDPGA